MAQAALRRAPKLEAVKGRLGGGPLHSRDAAQAPVAAFEEPAPSMIDDLIYRLQDKHVDLKRVQEAIRSRAGDIRDQINAYQTEELFHGRTAERVNAFLEGDLNPLLTEMRARGVELDEIGKYLWARHA